MFQELNWFECTWLCLKIRFLHYKTNFNEINYTFDFVSKFDH